jgi:hypothetical protein
MDGGQRREAPAEKLEVYQYADLGDYHPERLRVSPFGQVGGRW